MNSIRQKDEAASKFIVDACDAIEFRFCRSVDDIINSKPFKPGMCHQIFGPNEQIFGYSNLKIQFYYTASKLNQFYIKTYDEAIPCTDDGIEPDRVEAKLIDSDILQQENSATNLDHFAELVKQDAKFRPYGEKVHQFRKKDATFDVYKCTILTPGFTDWYKNLETFILWFIDGAQYIRLEDEQWDFFICYEVFKDVNNSQHWAPVAFATVFRYHVWLKDGTPMLRPRVSQMLVLPPFQRQGLATELLTCITNSYMRSDVLELTAEDPSEDFQRVRDYVDAKLCSNLDEFQHEKLRKGYTKEMARAAREKGKLCGLQARRIYEILLLNATSRADPEAMKKFRMIVKSRLNAPNKEKRTIKKAALLPNQPTPEVGSLGQKDEERKMHLKSLYESLFEKYEQVLTRLNRY